MKIIRLLSAVAILLAAAGIAAADPLPTQIGQCTNTTIKDVTTRLQDGATNRPIPGSGSAVDFANSGYQVSYDTIAEITQSHAGDPVTMCLVSIPKGCPPGDKRGLTYKTTNLRTHGTWTLPDSEHMCGGA
ncbi:MAG TPA: hypothetical protein VN808_01830 [Stellaceae bacterium]|nr:hypothetical protein [Stellaceae bacterium]